MLIVYVDDFVITRDDTKGIDNLQKYLQKYFQTKNFKSLKYFLGIEVASFKKGIFTVTESIYLTYFQRLGC